ncbi:hypothetical protein N9C31_01090 [Gammaproteobacteria bacterium]|nr:hypothetical protein [Gammaproteobacteria bacterium]
MKTLPEIVSEITPDSITLDSITLDSIQTLTEPFKDACYLFDNLKYLQNSRTSGESELATLILDKYNALTTPPTDSTTPVTDSLTPVQVMALLSKHEAIRPALENAAKKYRRNIIQAQNQEAVVAFNPYTALENAAKKYLRNIIQAQNQGADDRPFNPYDAATQNATNYADPMFEALKQHMDKNGLSELSKNRSSELDQESGANKLASVLGAMTVMPNLKNPLNWPLMILIPIVSVVAKLASFVRDIPFQKFSTLSNGNTPYQSTLTIPKKPPNINGEKTQFLEMGMPTMVRSSFLFFSKCSVDPFFEKHIKTPNKTFLYVSLLENKWQETPHLNALKSLESGNKGFYFMQMPPMHQIKKICLSALSGANSQEQKQEQLTKMILNNKNNFFISVKIKEAFGKDGEFASTVKAIIKVALESKLEPFNQINFINAELTSRIQQVLSPDEMCCVCKDGIDRGHAFKLNLMHHLQEDPQDPDTRAQFVKFRGINDNKITCENYAKVLPEDIMSMREEVNNNPELQSIAPTPPSPGASKDMQRPGAPPNQPITAPPGLERQASDQLKLDQPSNPQKPSPKQAQDKTPTPNRQ